MQPQTPEQNPQQPQTPEQNPQPEHLSGDERQAEVKNSPAPNEVSKGVAADPVVQLSKNTTNSQKPSNNTTNTTSLRVPATASNDDLMEKEWVEVGEKIIADHAEDPKTEETAQQNLSQNYVEKRFGSDVENTEK